MRLHESLLLALVCELATAQNCSPLHFIYARATTEPPMGQDNATPAQFEAAAAKSWSKGYGAAGKSMFGNITALIPEATGWPVHYPASWTGCTSEDKGVADIVREITSQAKACPQQKFVLGGHSQGGVVTLRAIPKIPADVFAKVIAVTMVGSPNCPPDIKAKCRSYCNKGDGICAEGTVDSKANGRCVGGANASKGGAVARPKAKALAFATEGATLEKRFIDMEATRKDWERAHAETPKLERRQYVTGALSSALCSQPEVSEKDHQSRLAGNAHMTYSGDGFFMPAAACFVYNKFKAST